MNGAFSVQATSASAMTMPGSANPPTMSVSATPPADDRYRVVRYAIGSTTATATTAALTASPAVFNVGDTRLEMSASRPSTLRPPVRPRIVHQLSTTTGAPMAREITVVTAATERIFQRPSGVWCGRAPTAEISTRDRRRLTPRSPTTIAIAIVARSRLIAIAAVSYTHLTL